MPTTLPRRRISLASMTWAISTPQHLPGNTLSLRRELPRTFLIEPIPYNYAIKMFASSYFLIDELNFLALWREHIQSESNLCYGINSRSRRFSMSGRGLRSRKFMTRNHRGRDGGETGEWRFYQTPVYASKPMGIKAYQIWFLLTINYVGIIAYIKFLRLCYHV